LRRAARRKRGREFARRDGTDGFRETQREARGEYIGPSAAERDAGRSQRPDEKRRGIDGADSETVDQQAGWELADGVCPEESRQQHAHGLGVETEVAHDGLGRDAEIAAVDVADQNAKEDESENDPAARGRAQHVLPLE